MCTQCRFWFSKIHKFPYFLCYVQRTLLCFLVKRHQNRVIICLWTWTNSSSFVFCILFSTVLLLKSFLLILLLVHKKALHQWPIFCLVIHSLVLGNLVQHKNIAKFPINCSLWTLVVFVITIFLHMPSTQFKVMQLVIPCKYYLKT